MEEEELKSEELEEEAEVVSSNVKVERGNVSGEVDFMREEERLHEEQDSSYVHRDD